MALARWATGTQFFPGTKTKPCGYIPKAPSTVILTLSPFIMHPFLVCLPGSRITDKINCLEIYTLMTCITLSRIVFMVACRTVSSRNIDGHDVGNKTLISNFHLERSHRTFMQNVFTSKIYSKSTCVGNSIYCKNMSCRTPTLLN